MKDTASRKMNFCELSPKRQKDPNNFPFYISLMCRTKEIMDKHFHCHVEQVAKQMISHTESTPVWVGSERDGVTKTTSMIWKGRLPFP